MVQPTNFENQDYMRGQYSGPENQVFDEKKPDQFKDENMYKYHENTQTFDPEV